MKSVSILEVAEPALWAELEAQAPLADHLGAALSPTRRVVKPSFDAELLPQLEAAGVTVLVRYARREAEEIAAAREDRRSRVEALPEEARRVLWSAQRHALDDQVAGIHAWDPMHDAPSVRLLHGQGLLQAVDDGAPPYAGRYRLDPDLPPPPMPDFDFEEAVMEELPEDLPEPGPGPVGVLHDLASLAAAVLKVGPRRTLAGTIAVTDGRKLGRQLGVEAVASSGRLSEDPRWARALAALEALKAASTDPISREIYVDLGLERTLAGDSAEAVDRFAHRLVERDLHVALPAVRAALREAGAGSVDEVIFLDLLRQQQRDVIFPAWAREGHLVYPLVSGDTPRLWDEEGWERVEARLIGVALNKLSRLGLIRRAPGVFAATVDGRLWADAVELAAPPPVWLGSDLVALVPPRAITPWERFQLERLGRCLSRDVVDRYKLEREALVGWLSTHDLDEAIALLQRRCAELPQAVVATLERWATSASRVVLTRGVLMEDEGSPQSASR